MEMDAPSVLQNKLIDKPKINFPIEPSTQVFNSFYKVANPKPIKDGKVVIKRGRFCFCRNKIRQYCYQKCDDFR